MNYIACLSCFLAGAAIASIIFFLFLKKIQHTIKQEFVQIANETIKNEQEDLRKQNRESLEEKLIPLKNELGEFKSKIEMFNLRGAENTVKIIEQIGHLEKNNKIIELETKNLVEALTKNQNVKGSYGEGILETILEHCGMKEGIHYYKQYSTSSIDLKNMETLSIRPDIIINLPNNRHLIIDSKVTLTSYLEYIKDNTKLKQFKDEIKKRIAELADKNYHLARDINQPDFVVMFLPVESSLGVLYEDNELIDYAYKSNIIITGTSGLLSVIRLVNQLLTQNMQNENIKQIVTAGCNLYETFVRFCNDLSKLQKDFENLSSQFNTTINRFKRNNKNKPSIFSQVEELKNLGINSSKTIPEEMFEYTATEGDFNGEDISY